MKTDEILQLGADTEELSESELEQVAGGGFASNLFSNVSRFVTSSQPEKQVASTRIRSIGALAYDIAML